MNVLSETLGEIAPQSPEGQVDGSSAHWVGPPAVACVVMDGA
jgi:hypothetical protein